MFTLKKFLFLFHSAFSRSSLLHSLLVLGEMNTWLFRISLFVPLYVDGNVGIDIRRFFKGLCASCIGI